MSRPENPPAFPIASEHLGHCQGMSLRDWFAGQMLQPAWVMVVEARKKDPQRAKEWAESHGGNYPTVAKIAYEMADAMLEERAKGNW